MTFSKGTKVAILVANGFEQNDYLQAQKMMADLGLKTAVISLTQGLVNAWNGEGWGHNYMVDVALNAALGVDYDALIIPGGHRSIHKMKMTAHTRRFISSFMNAGKPVAVMGDALEILDYTEQSAGRSIAAAEEACRLDGKLITGKRDEAFMAMMAQVFGQPVAEQAEAA